MTLLYLLLGVVLAIVFLALARVRRRPDWLVVAIGSPVAASGTRRGRNPN